MRFKRTDFSDEEHRRWLESMVTPGPAPAVWPIRRPVLGEEFWDVRLFDAVDDLNERLRKLEGGG